MTLSKRISLQLLLLFATIAGISCNVGYCPIENSARKLGHESIRLDDCTLLILFEIDKQHPDSQYVTLIFRNWRNEKALTVSDLNVDVHNMKSMMKCQLQRITARKQYFKDSLSQNIVVDTQTGFEIKPKNDYSLHYSFLSLDTEKSNLYSVTVKAKIKDNQKEDSVINVTFIFKKYKQVMIFH